MVNDGSTDDTLHRLSVYAGNERVRILTQENQGVSSARNRGLDAVRGKYVYFLDGDDLLMPGMLDTLVSSARQHDAVLVEGGYQLITREGAPGRVISHSSGRIGDRLGFSGFVCGKLFDRCLFSRVSFPDCSYEDSIMTQILVPMILQGGMTAWGLEEPVFCYRFNPSGITQSITSTPKAVDNLYITEALLRDREVLGLKLTQGYYENLLDMMVLGWIRAEGLPEEDRRALFVLFRRLLMREFPEYGTTLTRQKKL